MISAQEIDAMLRDCFFTEEELAKENPPKDFVPVEGIVQKFGFHPGRLAAKKERLKEILDDLDPKFMKGSGDGFTFLNLPFDKNGRHWGEHQNAEALIVLCMGNKMAQYCLPRDMWDALPGSVPYVVFSKEGFNG